LAQLRGLISTGMALHRKAYIIEILRHTISRIENLNDSHVLCELIEAAAALREMLNNEVAKEDEDTSLKTEPNTEGLDPNDEEGVYPDELTIASDLSFTIDSLIATLSKISKDLLPRLSHTELRRMLAVYSFTPIRADELISAVQSEMDRRRFDIIQGSRQTALSDIFDRLEKGAFHARHVQQELTNRPGSPFSGIKEVFKSFFRHGSDGDEAESDDKAAEQARILDELNEALSCLIDAAEYARKLSNTAHDRSNEESVALDHEQSALFELGKCDELLAHYRRVDFESGQRQTRLDEVLGRDMAKRVLSRLLP